MKNKLRTLYINNQQWKYAIDSKEVRIYNSLKQLHRVNIDKFVDYLNEEITPNNIKAYIKNNLINN